jgi:hypothetical protein
MGLIGRCDLHGILLIAIATLSTKQTTLRIPLQSGPVPEEIAVVTFDADRVSAQDVKRWMLLHESSYYDTPVFGYYPECKPSDVPKLEKDIKKTQQIVDDLDPNKYPPALTDVVRYLKDLQSLWLWQAQQELAFLNSGKLPQTEYNGVDLRMCEVRNFEDKQRMCYEVLHRWHNCATNTVGRRLGSYPKEKWKAALDALGIQEELGSGMNLDE